MKHFVFILYLLLTALLSQAADQFQITVAPDSSGDFTSVQAAINSAKSFPPQQIEIFIKNGTYYEKVKIPAWNPNITLRGESKEKTIITYDDYFDKINLGRNSTFYTYTLMVDANDCVIENLTIKNTSGPVGQAIALHVEADRCIFKNVNIIGHQDALYAAGENCRQYFTNCYIEGTTDFIFGAATALFENCTIMSKSNSYITAASTTQNIEFGFVFYQCSFEADSNNTNVYLGRPWRKHAKTVIIECYLGSHINPEGWKIWSNAEKPETAYYAEYKNHGPGSKTDQRVKWSNQLSKVEYKKYKKSSILW
jgi:pectinesterase